MSVPAQFLQGQKADTLQGGRGGAPHQVLYHMYTIWLFTVSDLHTTFIQTVLFGLAGAASGRLTTPTTTNDAQISPPPPYPAGTAAASAAAMARQLPWVALFVWLLLLLSQLANQSMPGAPEEDALNKPWRPIPAGRVTQRQVHRWLLPPAVLASLLLGYALGAPWEAAVFVPLVWAYSAAGGADSLAARNLLNGAALALLGEGALKLSASAQGQSQSQSLNAAGYAWTVATALVIATTVQVQDFRDQEGDAARGRKTLPLVLGDAAARWATVAPTLGWAALVPWLCGAGALGYGLSGAAAAVAALSLVVDRTPRADARSYKLWGVWIAIVYAMPWLALF